MKVNPEGKYVVDIDKDIDINKCTPNTRVALRNDSYVLHKILPTKVLLVLGSVLTTVCGTLLSASIALKSSQEKSLRESICHKEINVEEKPCVVEGPVSQI